VPRSSALEHEPHFTGPDTTLGPLYRLRTSQCLAGMSTAAVQAGSDESRTLSMTPFGLDKGPF
jgi:hypothetical protein